MKTLPRTLRFPFIALEGGDGSGKTSMRQYIFRRLSEAGTVALSTITTSWLLPEATELITKAKYAGMRFAPERIVAAYVADKEEFTRRQLSKQLHWRPCIVDRFILSDIANNEVLFGIPGAAMIEAYRNSEVLEPDVMVWLDTPPEIAMERLDRRSNRQRHAWEHLQQQQGLYAAFKRLLNDNPLQLQTRIVRLDNSGPIPATYQQLEQRVIEPLLAILGRQATDGSDR
jgi:dTMP kinase